MFSLLSEFTRRLGTRVHIIVMGKSELDQPSRYSLQPEKVLAGLVGGILFIFVLLFALILVSPFAEMLPGHVSDEMRQDARINELRLEAMEDTLRLQSAYVTQLRNLLMGTVDTTVTSLTRSRQSFPSRPGADIDLSTNLRTANFEDHLQPAIPLDRLRIAGQEPILSSDANAQHLKAIRFPVMPPVTGLTTRRFNARTGHFAIDIAVQEGSFVRAIGDGYVVLADWTHDGGQIIAVQHGDGYMSVYKHNSRLLKRVGDRVRARDALAMSGNSGEITTGPHLHFELWHNGLAQDPNYYVTEL